MLYIHSLGIIQSILTVYAMIIAGWDVFKMGKRNIKFLPFEIFRFSTTRLIGLLSVFFLTIIITVLCHSLFF